MTAKFRVSKILSLVALLVFPSLLHGEEYQVTGRFTYEAFENGDRQPAFKLEADFSVAVQGCVSQVRYVPVKHFVANSNYAVGEAEAILAFDGTNSYQFFTSANPKVVPGGRIASGPVPERAPHTMGLLWMAFASHCYFKSASTDLIHSPIIAPVNAVGIWAQDHRVHAKWSTAQENPGLPTNIVHSFEYAFDRSKLSREVVPNFTYEVATVTNYQGLVLPTKAAMKIFFPPGRLINSFTIDVSTVTDGVTLTDFVPIIRDKMFVTDERFLASDQVSFSYLVRNKWPSLEEGRVHLKEHLRQQSQNAGSGRKEQPKADVRLNWKLYTIVGLFIVAPIVLLLGRKLRS